jgi:hypothetical protein
MKKGNTCTKLLKRWSGGRMNVRLWLVQKINFGGGVSDKLEVWGEHGYAEKGLSRKGALL